MKRALALTMTAVIAASTLAGCGSGQSGTTTTAAGSTTTTAASSSASGSTTAASSSSDKPYEGVTLHYAATDTEAAGAEMQDIVQMVKDKTGINIEFTIIPKADTGEVDKRLVSLQAGDELDLIYGTTAQLKVFYDAGVLEPIDELASADGYDMKKVFGDSLPVYSDGKTYGLPAFNDIWCTFINKKVFEDAGVEIPTADGWTWEKYIETAQQLTQADKDIWGSFMLDYDCYNYMYAIQNGAEHYKEDGTSNYDDERFTESVKWFYSLGNDLKIQPDITSYKAGVYPWNGFVSTGVANEDGSYDKAQFGMFVCGGWAASMLPNTDKYPRDWECTILPMPYPEGQEPSTMTVTGCYAIPVTSKNKEAAFEALKCIAENQYTLGYGRVPARIDLTDEEIDTYIEENLVPTYADTDGITSEAFRDAWFDPDRKMLSEKVVGPADTTISQIWTSEAPLYGMGQQDLETTMTNILNRANEAIAEVQ
ncbi:MAG: ABC transporter substrate-binding protein [Lachnospiraceae bacterium]